MHPTATPTYGPSNAAQPNPAPTRSQLLNVMDVLHALHQLVDLVSVHTGCHVCCFALLLDGLPLRQQLRSLVILIHDLFKQQLTLVCLYHSTTQQSLLQTLQCSRKHCAQAPAGRHMNTTDMQQMVLHEGHWGVLSTL
eukprot:GHUV01022822.1.p2 GENE.GHUV01022822.1~~GHUV01022822.1.p2  ORF type:complete len:138 (+),score=26.92 GHUV01022822.1:1598-2011(+)